MNIDSTCKGSGRIIELRLEKFSLNLPAPIAMKNFLMTLKDNFYKTGIIFSLVQCFSFLNLINSLVRRVKIAENFRAYFKNI